MKSFNKICMFAFIYLLILPVIMLQGCGKDGSQEAPAGSTIAINPETLDLSNINMYGDVIQNYVVTVFYSNGLPMPNALVHIAGSYAWPVVSSTTSTLMVPRYQFWGYPNANANPNNVPVGNKFDALTDESGTYTFSIQIYSSVTISSIIYPNAFTDVINVTSGSAIATSDLNVTAN